jgi:hypothetical protein
MPVSTADTVDGADTVYLNSLVCTSLQHCFILQAERMMCTGLAGGLLYAVLLLRVVILLFAACI